jgi:hypothetical protein
VAVVQCTFTHKQYTEQHHETEYTEQNKYNNTTYITMRKCEEKRIFGIPDVDRWMLLIQILKEVARCRKD